MIERFVKSEHTVIRRAAAESAASAVFNADPKRLADRTSAYFIDVSRRTVPQLAKAAEDKDTTTQKQALGGIQSAANILNGLYTIDTEPTEIGAKPVDRQTKFGPVIRAWQPPFRSSARRSALRMLRRESPPPARSKAWRSFASRFFHLAGLPTRRLPTRSRAAGCSFATGSKQASRTPIRTCGSRRSKRSNRWATPWRCGGSYAAERKIRWCSFAGHPHGLGESAPVKPVATEVAPDVAALTPLVDDADLDVRTAAITAIGRYGPAAKSAAPRLLAAVGKGDIEPRVAAVTALSEIDSDAESTVPVLIEGLRNEDLRLRRASATGLVRFRRAAKPALPELRKATRRHRPGTTPRRRGSDPGDRAEGEIQGTVRATPSWLRRQSDT